MKAHAYVAPVLGLATILAVGAALPAGDSIAHRVFGAQLCTDDENGVNLPCGCIAGNVATPRTGGIALAIQQSVAQPCGTGPTCQTKYEYILDPRGFKMVCTDPD